MLALDQVTRADFLPALDQDFELTTGADGASLTLKLAAVEARGPGNPTRAEPFGLIFHGAPSLRLPQCIYHLENKTLGAMEIFIVQLGDNATESTFEAVFN